MEEESEVVTETTTISVYLEYKPRLSVAQIVVILPNELRADSTFSVRKTGLGFDHVNKLLKTNVVFQGIRLVPPSCHSMQFVATGEMQMRIQAQKIDTGESGRRRERVLSGDYTDQLEAEFAKINNGKQNGRSSAKMTVTEAPIEKGVEALFRCSMCGGDVVKAGRFERVLPLPGDNWEELTDSWFCCKHKHDKGSHGDGECRGLDVNPPPLVPRADDCLYGDLIYIISKARLKTQCVQSQDDGSLQCARCMNLIGKITRKDNGVSTDQVPVVLHKYQVSITTPDVKRTFEDKQIWLDNFEHGICQLLQNYSLHQNCFRFVIEKPTEDSGSKPFLLLWLMDADNVVYQGSVKQGQTHPEIISPIYTAKVIYRECSKDTRLSLEWRKDLGAMCISLPYVQCLELLQLLICKTARLPPCLRKANDDFLVGYLESGKPCAL